MHSQLGKVVGKSRTQQSLKVLWVVFSSLFFKQISKDISLQVLKESIKSRFDSYSVRNKCIDHIPYYLSGLSRAQFFRQPF